MTRDKKPLAPTLKGKHLVYLNKVFVRREVFSCALTIVLFALAFHSKGQSPFKAWEPLFTEPKHYIAYYTDNRPVIDGNLDDGVWQTAIWTDKFVDIEGSGKARPPVNTQVKMAWDESYLYLAARLEEPHVWATLQNHDEIVFYDNDFEIFIDPDNNTHQYFEIEVNAYNTIFDLFLPKPYRNGSGALISWDIKNLQSAIQVQGTINDPGDLDKSWTIEMAIPLSQISLGNSPKPIKEGTLWRINFSRVQWDTHIKDGKYIKTKGKDGHPLSEHNWVWSPQGVINMHYPERWGYLLFSRANSETQPASFTLSLAEKQKRYLWLVYYQQKEYHQKHGRYATTLAAIDLQHHTAFTIGEQHYQLKLEATPYQFIAMVQGQETESWCIDQEGLTRKIRTKK